MKLPVTAALFVARICFVAQLVLGLAFWTGNALNLVPVHVTIGLVLILALWTVAAIAAVARVNPAQVAVAAVWGVGVILLGLNQGSLLTGDLHWLIRLLHLLVGVATIAQVEMLARRVLVSPAATRPV